MSNITKALCPAIYNESLEARLWVGNIDILQVSEYIVIFDLAFFNIFGDLNHFYQFTDILFFKRCVNSANFLHLNGSVILKVLEKENHEASRLSPM